MWRVKSWLYAAICWTVDQSAELSAHTTMQLNVPSISLLADSFHSSSESHNKFQAIKQNDNVLTTQSPAEVIKFIN